MLGIALHSSQADDREKFSAATEAAHKANETAEPIAPGKFQPTWDSLQQYQTPEWFRDAKLGIWAHWGPQCQPEMSDWYARKMYQQYNTDKKTGAITLNQVYSFHVARYGHPSQFGFKDVIQTWQAERWDPDKLMEIYKRAGAKYFMALANHHDNMDLWDSKYQPWNSVNVGPHKDLIAGWEKAARKQGLRFAVSVHASRAWSWYEPAQEADKDGSKKDVPYDGKLTAAGGKGKWWDGLDPQDLYAQNHTPGEKLEWSWDAAKGSSVPDAEYCQKFYNRTVDLVNRYHPDMIYFDDTVLPLYPISDVGLKFAAHYYNSNMALHGGKLEAVINGKHLDDLQKKCLLYDIERGKAEGILPLAWQTDTCLGDWHYHRSLYERDGYKKPADVIQMLVDIVSKNGNLMLNVPLRGEGTVDDKELLVLRALGDWMEVNGSAIYASRPWKVYGEGPSTESGSNEKGHFDGIKDIGKFSAADVRYTTSKDGKILYAFVLGWPENGKIVLKSLASQSPLYPEKITGVKLLASPEKIITERTVEGLVISFPASKPKSGQDAAYAFKIVSEK